MTEPYTGTIQLFAFNFPPRGWATCDGQTLSINTNQALFSLLGTTYGGDGMRTFCLPDLRGRTPISMGPNTVIGAKAGEEQHVLLTSEMPMHNHSVMTDATTPATSNSNQPTSGSVLGQSVGWDSDDSSTYTLDIYATGVNPNETMAPQSLASIGNSAPHENRMPYLVMNFSIALTGIFPSRG